MVFGRSGLFRSGRGSAPGADSGSLAGANMSALVQGYPGPALVTDRTGRVIAANAGAHDLSQGLQSGSQRDLQARIVRVAELGEPAQEQLELGSRQVRALMQLTIMPLTMTDGQVAVLVMGRDATMERNLTTALVASRQMFKDLVECSTDFAWETDSEGHFVFVSPLGALGFTAEQLEHTDSGALCSDAEAVALFAVREPVERQEAVLIARDGGGRICQVSARPVRDQKGQWAGARGVVQDVTEERRQTAELRAAHERLEQLSRIDDLTGLLNRRAFLDELTRRVLHMQRHRRPGALLFIDLNNFKAVNDHRGHAAGDEALRAFGQAITEECRVGDLVARLGGDEFAVWLEETDAQGAAVKAHALRRIGADMHLRFGSAVAPLGVAMGIALHGPDDEESVPDLIARADAAMYRDKAAFPDRLPMTKSGGSAA